VLDVEAILKTLSKNQVDFVIVGGLAAIAHGSAHLTKDLDLCYARDRANLERLARALTPFRPRLRGAPENLPFQWDVATVRAGLNFTLVTDLGNIDLWGEIAGFGSYEEIIANSETLELYGFLCRILTLEGLIRAKKAVGREKDLQLIPELEALRALKQEESDAAGE
jgi:predicted nucleotidyltransferase